jgi:hypothetical protein
MDFLYFDSEGEIFIKKTTTQNLNDNSMDGWFEYK